MAENIKFKDYFDPALARSMADAFSQVYTGFPADAFREQIVSQLEPLELKARVAVFSEAMRTHLPQDYPAALEIIYQMMPPELPAQDAEGVTEQTAMWPIAHFVEVYGLDHFEESMAAMLAVTKRFSAEFAIRPYIERYPERTLQRLKTWTQDPNHHVRRLCSEGTRPRLPWASYLTQFIEDPSPVLPILEALKDDPSDYVRRSVANHLNDITKDNPDVALDVLRRWNLNPTERIRWITQRALRTMVKDGSREALTLLGYGPPQVQVRDVRISPEAIELGEAVTLSFALESAAEQAQDLMVDYIVHHVRANGETIPKVFKLTKKTLQPGDRLEVSKNHSMKRVTTRVYYPGLHRVEVQINGRVLGEAAFELLSSR